MSSEVSVRRVISTPASLQPGELATNLTTGELFVGDDSGKPILVNPQARLIGRGVDFWLKVALGAVAAWVLLQIYERIGAGFLLSHQAKVGSPNITGDGQVGGFLDVADAAYLAWVKIVEALAALGTVVLIAMKDIWTKLWSLIWGLISRYLLARHPVTGAAVGLIAKLIDRFKKPAVASQSKSPGWGSPTPMQYPANWNAPGPLQFYPPYTAPVASQLQAVTVSQVATELVKPVAEKPAATVTAPSAPAPKPAEPVQPAPAPTTKPAS